ncbi:MAG: NnrS family protein [Bryobacteraceae bacterium]
MTRIEIMAPIPRLKAYSGPALLSYGFRPFFLLGAFYAGLGVLIWLPLFFGDVRIPTAFSPLDWHIHEMLYGYLPAVITGFLLTAIPNWTGRLPLQGGPLAILVAVWMAGRIAVSISVYIGPLATAVIDVSFLLMIAAAAAREIVAGRNWRNLPPVVIVLVFFAGNVIFHVEDYETGTAELGTRLGIAAAVTLISLMGGRVIPSFTRNWLARENPGRLPVPFGRFDIAVLAITLLALGLWVSSSDW